MMRPLASKGAGIVGLDVLSLEVPSLTKPSVSDNESGAPTPILIYLTLLSPPGLSHPFSIDVFEDYIYGVTYINNRVFKIHKFGHSPLINLTGGLSHASDVVLYHQHKQPEGVAGKSSEEGVFWGHGAREEPCSASTPSFRTPAVTNPCDRKKCEWLCLLSPSGPVCTCPNGKRLDNGTCVPVPSPTPPPDGMHTPCLGTLGSSPGASAFPDPWSQPSV